MDIKSIFTDSFLSEVKTKLDELCTDGNAITRRTLCEALDLDEVLEPCISAALSLDLVEGYDSRRGRGIGIKGSSTKKSTSSESKLTPDFLDHLSSTLNDLFPANDSHGVCLPRKEIAEAMGDPTTKCEQLISLALKTSDRFNTTFASKPGRSGGVFRVGTADDSNQDNSQDEIMAEEVSVDETVSLDETLPLEEDMDVEDEDDLDSCNITFNSQYLNPNGPLARFHAAKKQELLEEDSFSEEDSL